MSVGKTDFDVADVGSGAASLMRNIDDRDACRPGRGSASACGSDEEEKDRENVRSHGSTKNYGEALPDLSGKKLGESRTPRGRRSFWRCLEERRKEGSAGSQEYSLPTYGKLLSEVEKRFAGRRGGKWAEVGVSVALPPASGDREIQVRPTEWIRPNECVDGLGYIQRRELIR